MTPGRLRWSFSLALCLCLCCPYTRSSGAAEPAEQGLKDVERGDYSTALIHLRQAVALDSVDVESWRLLGFAYRMLDSLNLAVAAYQEVLENLPKDRDASLALGHIYALKGEYTASLARYDTLLSWDADDLDAGLGRAKTLAWMDDLRGAENGCRALLATHPNYTDAMLQLAEVLAWQDHLGDAAGVYQSLLSLDSTRSDVWKGIARVESWADHPYGAQSYFQRALTLHPEDVEARQGLEEVERQVSWNLNPEYRYWAEEDAGLVTEHEEMALTASRRLSDRLQTGGRFGTYTSFRQGQLLLRRSLGLQGTWLARSGLSLDGEWAVDVLSGQMETARLTARDRSIASAPWLESSAYLERVLYEPWTGTVSTGGWGEVSLRPLPSIAFILGAGYWNLSDRNFRRQGLATLSFRALKKPRALLLLRTRYLDFGSRITGYFSPQDLQQHEIGAVLNWAPVRLLELAATGFYGLNTAEIRSIWLEGSAVWKLLPNFSLAAGATYFETDSNYRYVLWNLGLILTGWR